MTRLLLWTVFAAVFVGCGGSSSETPPPLEPDYDRLEARRRADAARSRRGQSKKKASDTPSPSPSADPALQADTWGRAPTPPPSAKSDLEEPPF